MRYTLKDEGFPYKKIYHGRKWVGRVWFNQIDKMYTGKIGQTEHRDVTALTAFEGVVSRHLGYEDVVALKMHNQEVKAANRASKARAQHAFNEYRNGNFDPLFNLIVGGNVKVRP